MKGQLGERRRVGWAVVALMVATTVAYGRERHSGPRFKYVGGTDGLGESCAGNLELGLTGLTFRCPLGFVAVPYSAIELMQYRPDISRKVLKMKLKWKLKPVVESGLVGSKRNRYFTVVYRGASEARAMVLDVLPEAMLPYLAEIDLKAGKRVEVKPQEGYD